MVKSTRVKKNKLFNSVIKGIISKKGQDIVSIDIRGTGAGICDYFILCNGTSRTHVEAIADSVEETVKKQVGEKPWHIEGYQNAEWILIDYIDIVVHIFKPEIRNFYQLEKLWGDGIIEYINE